MSSGAHNVSTGRSQRSSTSQAARLAGHGRIVGAGRHEQRELPGAGHVLLVGERGAVRLDLAIGQLRGHRRPLQPLAGVEEGHRLARLLPLHEALTGRRTIGKDGVGEDEAIAAIGVLGGEAQAEQPAPVLTEQDDVGRSSRSTNELSQATCPA